MKSWVHRNLRLIILGAVFFLFGILPVLPLGRFAWGMGMHPSVEKLLRAYGGCLGAKCRRRTWDTAISLGKPCTGVIPGLGIRDACGLHEEWGSQVAMTSLSS
jgi:hypothetical protein